MAAVMKGNKHSSSGSKAYLLLHFMLIQFPFRVPSHGCHGGRRVLPHVIDHDGLTEHRAVMKARAAVPMAASASLRSSKQQRAGGNGKGSSGWAERGQGRKRPALLHTL